jgi:hypothetical protein
VRRVLLLLAGSAAFGAADQFLGARASVVGAWAIDASAYLSAPWLLVALAAGWTQPTARRAMGLGLACTLAALAGYCAMTLSPVEGAVVTLAGVRGLLVGQWRWVAGALVTGPLFGWLGHRWRRRAELASGLVAAGVLLCEPLAHAVAGTHVTSRAVWVAETAAGLLVAAYAVRRSAPARRRP